MRQKFYVYWIVKKEWTSRVCRWWPCNGRCGHLKIQSDYGGNSLNKGILEKLKKERKGLGFYIAANKLKP